VEESAWQEASVFPSHRQAAVLDLYEKIATHQSRGGRNQKSFRDQLDRLLLNPFAGLLVIVSSILLMFASAFWLGDAISSLLSPVFGALGAWSDSLGHGVATVVLRGLLAGVEGGIGIVLPYLVPLLVLLSIYEDTGFLPRIAFMVDGLLHRFGLHGKTVMPFILGYGCTVPALMATRNLENSRDRFMAMLLVPFIACSARTVVILALAGKFLGSGITAMVYVGNIGVVLFISFLLSRFRIDLSSGIIMDVPPLRRPYAGIIAKKVWLSLHEFLVVAWPVIVVSSLVLELMTLYGVDAPINNFLSPLTEGILKLPPQVGIAMFLGVFRKELALIMLATALGTSDVSRVLSHSQLLTIVVFTVLYIPCVASLATLWKEGGWRVMVVSSSLSMMVAIAIAAIVARIPL
jgi:ferrous iron transport protein B